MERMMLSGVDGSGVATRSRSVTRRPVETSTAAALIPLPPTSTPIAIRRSVNVPLRASRPLGRGLSGQFYRPGPRPAGVIAPQRAVTTVRLPSSSRTKVSSTLTPAIDGFQANAIPDRIGV